jgi:hypothetical protein
LAATLLLTAAIPVLADNTDLSPFATESLIDYAHSRAKAYLKISELTSLPQISISQPYPILNNADNNDFFFLVFSRDNHIGNLIVTLIDGVFISSFSQQTSSTIQTALTNQLPIAIFILNNERYLFCNNSILSFEGDYASYQNFNIDTSSFSTSHISLFPIEFSNPQTIDARGSSVLDINLNVPFVANDSSPHNGTGLCWCACLSAIGTYRTGLPLESAMDIYDWACKEVLIPGYIYPEGIEVFEQAVLQGKYSLTCYSYSHSHALDVNTITNTLNQYKPIYAGIQYNNNIYTRHAIVIRGVYFDIETLSYYLIVMDPNEPSGYPSVLISYDGTTFNYVTSYGQTYNKWFRSIY